MMRRTHCKNGHDLTAPGSRYESSRQCRICQLARANRRNAAKYAEGLCPRCGNEVEIRKRVRKGKEFPVRFCVTCAHRNNGYAAGSGEPGAFKEASTSTLMLLRLGKMLEHAMPWERDGIRKAIEWWQRKADHGQQVTT